MVDILVNLEGAMGKQIERAMTVDAQKAEAGLGAIRASLEKATTYEHNWLDSGMPVVSRWLTLASARVSTVLSAPVFIQAEDGIRNYKVTGVQTCALPI